ncbi:MAG: hypothetical protein CMC08_01740 [Flavobacteriaceae bacterium]|nr:hypothetical protein [Flavobacteriaceae bacterium]|tara:strand:+ start:105 stop:614 length:510 start_codon:yes stop_codon:yes gene_type:complete
MKKFKLVAVALVLFMGATSFVSAQTKVAHINTQELVEAMPQMKEAQNQLDKLRTTYDTEIKNMMKEYDGKIKQYDSEAGSKTDEENQKRVSEVQGMQNNIANYRQEAMKQLQQKEVDLLQPILEKARAAIQKVARAKGYLYVMDSTTGSGLILADGPDLMADVKKELGI